ncbi:MAG: oligosaccharide flippase family protein [Candidatus Woykebacteria bacterium]
MKKATLSDKVGFVSIGNVALLASNLIISIFLARLLSRDIFGTYKQVFLVYNVVSPLILLGIPASLLYFIPRLENHIGKKQFAWQTIYLLLFLGLIMSVFTFTTAGLFAERFNNPELRNLLRIFSIAPPILFVASYYPQLMIALDKVKISTFFTIVFAFFTTAATVVVALFGAGLPQIILVTIATGFIKVLFFLTHTVKHLGFTVKFKLKQFRSQLSYSIPLALSVFVGKVGWDIDRFIVSLFYPAGTFAVYAVAADQLPIVPILNAAVGAVLIPEIARRIKEGENKGVIDLWHRAMRRQSIVVFPIFVYTIIMAEAIVTLLFSDTYKDSAYYFQIYQLLLPLRIAQYGVIFQAVGWTKLNLAGGVFFLVLNTFLSFIMVKTTGLAGPAWATVVATFALAGFYVFFLIRKFPAFSLGNILPWKDLAANFFIAVGAALAIIPFYLINLPKLIMLLSSGICYVVLYIVLGLIFNRITSSDIELAKRWINLNVFRYHG